VTVLSLPPGIILEERADESMKNPILPPTAEERSFLDHFNHETFNHYLGPAIAWLNDQGLDWKLMAVFQRWGVLQDPDFMRKVNGEEPLAPFEIPWSTRDMLICRIQEVLEVYPDLRPFILPALKLGISA
jgi:hypothetical protein